MKDFANTATNPSNPHIRLRVVRQLGDLILLNKLFRGKVLYRLFLEGKVLWLELLGDYFWLVVGILANISGVFLRYKHGMNTMGFILTIYCIAFLLLYNTASIPWAAKPFVHLVAPVLPFIVDWESLERAVTVGIHSKSLLVFTMAYTLMAVVHTIIIYIGRGNLERRKRGNSWLFEFLFKRSGFVSEYFVQGILEPIFLAGVAYLLWTLGDLHIAVLLWLSAAAMAIQEVIDESDHAKNRPHI